MKSINPYSGELIKEYKNNSLSEVVEIIELQNDAYLLWRKTSFLQRSELMKKTAKLLRENADKYAKIITNEMGKIIGESRAEVEKCANLCDFYADNAENFLRNEIIETDADLSYIKYEPIGTIFAIMPWNFPFWQVFRFAIPNIMAGNTALLKHSPNVNGCALIIEEIFTKAGFPKNIFKSILIPVELAENVISHDLIKGVTLTGSPKAGSAVASLAGKYLKKSVLELGGSDPYIVLKDAEINESCKNGTCSRMMNSGQVCISAKRFLVEEEIVEDFIKKQKSILENMTLGNPLDENIDMGPMARFDLVENIHHQVTESIKMGAKLICGGEISKENKMFYKPTLLTNVKKGMPVLEEETFGPVSVVIPVKDADEAVKIANDSMFGLGASIWTKDFKKCEEIANKIEAGAVFVNGMTKSDPRLPFGGIKKSGYGRELSRHGIREFMNIKSVWIKR